MPHAALAGSTSTMTDGNAATILLAAQELALLLRDEGPDAVRKAAQRVLDAAGGDPLAAVAVTAALIDVDMPTNPWWQRPERILRPCGTPSAYARHLYHHEPPCDACKHAHREVRKHRRWAAA